MGKRLVSMFEDIRKLKGQWFLARVALRLKFKIDDAASVDDKEVAQVLEACQALGFKWPSDPQRI